MSSKFIKGEAGSLYQLEFYPNGIGSGAGTHIALGLKRVCLMDLVGEEENKITLKFTLHHGTI